MPDNKRQHFVPKFTLKRFASDPDSKQINLVNLKRVKIIRGASLRDQCYRDYFYGKTAEIEKQIAGMEGHFNTAISSIIENDAISSSLETTITLVTIVSLQHSRTLLAEEETNTIFDQMAKLLAHGKIGRDALEKLTVEMKDAAVFSVRTSLLARPIMYDLKHFLLLNRTAIPFVISDNPVVHTNWFCHSKLPGRSGGGIAKAGLQVVMPISPRHAIFLHDSNVYISDAPNRVIQVRAEEEMDLLNELQWLNAYKNVYFPPDWTEEKIQKALSWERPTQILPQLNRLKPVSEEEIYVESGKSIFEPPDQGQTRELIHFQLRELPKDIRISGVRLKPKPRYWDNGSAGSPQRDHVWDNIVEEFMSFVEQKKIKPSEFWLFANQHTKIGQIRWLRRAARKRQPVE